MPTPKPSAYVRRSGVRVLFAPETAGGNPGTFVTIKSHITGSVTVNDSRNSQTVRSFGTAYSDFDLTYTDGRTGSVSITVNLVPTDAGYIALKAAYEANAYGYLYIEGLDEGATPTGEKLKYGVMLSQFNRTFNQENVAQANINFVITGAATFTDPA